MYVKLENNIVACHLTIQEFLALWDLYKKSILSYFCRTVPSILRITPAIREYFRIQIMRFWDDWSIMPNQKNFLETEFVRMNKLFSVPEIAQNFLNVGR